MTPTPEEVEAVARALAKSHFCIGDDPNDEPTAWQVESMEQDANVAIAALDAARARKG